MPAWIQSLEGPVKTRDERFTSQLNILQQIDQDKHHAKTNHDLPSCIKKTFGYLSNVSREDFTIFFNWKGKEHRYEFNRPDKVVVSDNLFRSYSCLDYGCSKCCWYVGFWNIFSNRQMMKMIEKYGSEQGKDYDIIHVGLHNQDLSTQGVKNLHIRQHVGTVCQHLDRSTNSCSIHEENPIHCAFPLVKVQRVKNTTHITRQKFGRNDMTIQCPADFKPMTQSGFDYTIKLLERLRSFGEEMQIKTHMDDVIRECNFMWEKRSWEQTSLEELQNDL